MTYRIGGSSWFELNSFWSKAARSGTSWFEDFEARAAVAAVAAAAVQGSNELSRDAGRTDSTDWSDGRIEICLEAFTKLCHFAPPPYRGGAKWQSFVTFFIASLFFLFVLGSTWWSRGSCLPGRSCTEQAQHRGEMKSWEHWASNNEVHFLEENTLPADEAQALADEVLWNWKSFEWEQFADSQKLADSSCSFTFAEFFSKTSTSQRQKALKEIDLLDSGRLVAGKFEEPGQAVLGQGPGDFPGTGRQRRSTDRGWGALGIY